MALRKPGVGGLVYSTDVGRTCPACRQPVADCRCAAAAAAAAAARPRGDGTVRVGRETGGRGGKVVTVVRGLDVDDAALAAIGKSLRTLCGSGGTVKDGVVEIQGEHRDRVADWLAGRGHRVKRV